MALPVLIIGKSGSGKSASLRNFKKSEVDIINVEGKPLPFKNDLTTFNTDDYQKVMAGIQKSQKDVIVIDDAGYLITNMFMKNHSSVGVGNAVFSLYNDMADKFWTLIETIKEYVADNKIVYLMMHEEKNEFGDVKPKTIGKLLDEKVCIEGMFTIVLRAEKDGDNYQFKTKASGLDVTKTPMGMFEEDAVENDLKAVDAVIREYYNIGGKNND